MTDEDGPELSREGADDLLLPLPKALKTGKSSPAPDHHHHQDDNTMGYMMHPDRQQYSCATCPFVCKSLTDIEGHRQQHKPGPGRPVKCTLCPFFVADKQ